MSFYRLSLAIECAAVLVSPVRGVPPVASNSLTPGQVEFAHLHLYNCLIYHMFRHYDCHISSAVLQHLSIGN